MGFDEVGEVRQVLFCELDVAAEEVVDARL